MKKSELKIGDMVVTRDGQKYILTSEENLSSVEFGFMPLNYYDENLLLNKNQSDKYGYDDFDIVKVYRPNNHGSYELLYEKKNNEMATKEYVIEQIDTSEDCKGEHWDIKISPNHKDGYGQADGNMQIQLSSVDDYYDDNLFLSVQGAKEMVKALNEIIDYLEN